MTDGIRTTVSTRKHPGENTLRIALRDRTVEIILIDEHDNQVAGRAFALTEIIGMLEAR